MNSDKDKALKKAGKLISNIEKNIVRAMKILIDLGLLDDEQKKLYDEFKQVLISKKDDKKIEGGGIFDMFNSFFDYLKRTGLVHKILDELSRFDIPFTTVGSAIVKDLGYGIVDKKDINFDDFDDVGYSFCRHKNIYSGKSNKPVDDVIGGMNENYRGYNYREFYDSSEYYPTHYNDFTFASEEPSAMYSTIKKKHLI